jgi:hypothetical protein
MFKGAKKYGGKEFDKILRSNGATNNAFTSQDFTGYYENFPSSKLELIADMESDRMQNLQLMYENLKKELELLDTKNAGIEFTIQKLKERIASLEIELEQEEKRWREIDNKKKQLFVEHCKTVQDLERIDWNLSLEKPIRIRIELPKNKFTKEKFLEVNIEATINTASPFSAGGGETYRFQDIETYKEKLYDIENKNAKGFFSGFQEKKDRDNKIFFLLHFIHYDGSSTVVDSIQISDKSITIL